MHGAAIESCSGRWHEYVYHSLRKRGGETKRDHRPTCIFFLSRDEATLYTDVKSGLEYTMERLTQEKAVNDATKQAT
jgi:hypothetical protein